MFHLWDSASDRCEGGRGGKSEGETEREENVGRVVMSTPVVINGSTSEANADEEHTPIHFKTEEGGCGFILKTAALRVQCGCPTLWSERV